MSEQTLLTIQQYATKHKISTFAAIKLVNQKKLKTVKKTVNDEEKEYIVEESLPSKPMIEEAEEPSPTASSIDYEVEFHKLLAKYVELQEKYTRLIEEKSHASK